jgi:hypothetical protein
VEAVEFMDEELNFTKSRLWPFFLIGISLVDCLGLFYVAISIGFWSMGTELAHQRIALWILAFLVTLIAAFVSLFHMRKRPLVSTLVFLTPAILVFALFLLPLWYFSGGT